MRKFLHAVVCVLFLTAENFSEKKGNGENVSSRTVCNWHARNEECDGKSFCCRSTHTVLLLLLLLLRLLLVCPCLAPLPANVNGGLHCAKHCSTNVLFTTFRVWWKRWRFRCGFYVFSYYLNGRRNGQNNMPTRHTYRVCACWWCSRFGISCAYTNRNGYGHFTRPESEFQTHNNKLWKMTNNLLSIEFEWYGATIDHWNGQNLDIELERIQYHIISRLNPEKAH